MFNNSIRTVAATLLASSVLFAGSAIAAPSPSAPVPTPTASEKPKPSKAPKVKKSPKNEFVKCVQARAKNKAAKKDHIGNGKACKNSKIKSPTEKEID